METGRSRANVLDAGRIGAVKVGGRLSHKLGDAQFSSLAVILDGWIDVLHDKAGLMLTGLNFRDDLVNAFFNINCLANHSVGEQLQLSRFVIEDHAGVDRLGLQRRRDAGKVAPRAGRLKSW